MGLPEEQISSTIRISLGPETTLQEIDGFVQAWRSLYTKKNSNHAADLAG
jgi:cysteine sulfinate desulfinase/cysteine desulfurase-like protein